MSSRWYGKRSGQNPNADRNFRATLLRTLFNEQHGGKQPQEVSEDERQSFTELTERLTNLELAELLQSSQIEQDNDPYDSEKEFGTVRTAGPATNAVAAAAAAADPATGSANPIPGTAAATPPSDPNGTPNGQQSSPDFFDELFDGRHLEEVEAAAAAGPAVYDDDAGVASSSNESQDLNDDYSAAAGSTPAAAEAAAGPTTNAVAAAATAADPATTPETRDAANVSAAAAAAAVSATGTRIPWGEDPSKSEVSNPKEEKAAKKPRIEKPLEEQIETLKENIADLELRAFIAGPNTKRENKLKKLQEKLAAKTGKALLRLPDAIAESSGRSTDWTTASRPKATAAVKRKGSTAGANRSKRPHVSSSPPAAKASAGSSPEAAEAVPSPSAASGSTPEETVADLLEEILNSPAAATDRAQEREPLPAATANAAAAPSPSAATGRPQQGAPRPAAAGAATAPSWIEINETAKKIPRPTFEEVAKDVITFPKIEKLKWNEPRVIRRSRSEAQLAAMIEEDKPRKFKRYCDWVLVAIKTGALKTPNFTDVCDRHEWPVLKLKDAPHERLAYPSVDDIRRKTGIAYAEPEVIRGSAEDIIQRLGDRVGDMLLWDNRVSTGGTHDEKGGLAKFVGGFEYPRLTIPNPGLEDWRPTMDAEGFIVTVPELPQDLEYPDRDFRKYKLKQLRLRWCYGGYNAGQWSYLFKSAKKTTPCLAAQRFQHFTEDWMGRVLYCVDLNCIVALVEMDKEVEVSPSPPPKEPYVREQRLTGYDTFQIGSRRDRVKTMFLDAFAMKKPTQEKIAKDETYKTHKIWLRSKYGGRLVTMQQSLYEIIGPEGPAPHYESIEDYKSAFLASESDPILFQSKRARNLWAEQFTNPAEPKWNPYFSRFCSVDKETKYSGEGLRNGTYAGIGRLSKNRDRKTIDQAVKEFPDMMRQWVFVGKVIPVEEDTEINYKVSKTVNEKIKGSVRLYGQMRDEKDGVCNFIHPLEERYRLGHTQSRFPRSCVNVTNMPNSDNLRKETLTPIVEGFTEEWKTWARKTCNHGKSDAFEVRRRNAMHPNYQAGIRFPLSNKWRESGDTLDKAIRKTPAVEVEVQLKYDGIYVFAYYSGSDKTLVFGTKTVPVAVVYDPSLRHLSEEQKNEEEVDRCTRYIQWLKNLPEERQQNAAYKYKLALETWTRKLTLAQTRGTSGGAVYRPAPLWTSRRRSNIEEPLRRIHAQNPRLMQQLYDMLSKAPEGEGYIQFELTPFSIEGPTVGAIQPPKRDAEALNQWRLKPVDVNNDVINLGVGTTTWKDLEITIAVKHIKVRNVSEEPISIWRPGYGDHHETVVGPNETCEKVESDSYLAVKRTPTVERTYLYQVAAPM